MTCNEARQALLSAELAELRADGESGLVLHLRGCASCAALAMRLHSATRSLAAVTLRTPATTPRYRRIIGWALVPLAAAAVAVFVLRGSDEKVATHTEDARIADVVSVDVRPGQTATVIKTKDPKVTIVWLTQGGTE